MTSGAARQRLVLIGVDGMDYDLTQSLLEYLPNLRRLRDAGAFGPFRSVFPPDSIPAWITAYTGLDPSEHGVLKSVDYFAKGHDRLKVDTSVLRGRTFWDIVGSNGFSVCVINPFMAYPVWDVNGVMVNGPVFISGEVQVSDPARVEGIRAPSSLGGIVAFPSKKTLARFREKIFADTREQAEFGRALFARNRPDLFFQTFLTMDRIEHFLWRYSDPRDPTYPGPNPLEESIRDFYQMIDAEIGKFLALLEPDDLLLVLSDHGHGQRCTHCFNVNEYLRRRGDVVSRAEKNRLSPARVVEFCKNRVLDLMDRFDLQDYIKVVAKIVPHVRKLKTGKHLTDNARNRAYASDFTGTNPFGGVCINKGLVTDYEEFRDSLMKDLEAVKFEGKPVFQWMKKREEMFAGEYLDRFPDILFEMRPELGINWALHTDLFTRNPTHKAISGGHRTMGVVFANRRSQFPREPARIEDLFSVILSFFGIEEPEGKKRNQREV